MNLQELLRSLSAITSTAWIAHAADELDRLTAECERLRADAERWRAMRECLIAVDWDYGEPPMSVAVFELHSGVVMAGPEGADAIADAAIEARKA